MCLCCYVCVCKVIIYTYTHKLCFIFQSNWIQLNKLEVWNARWNIFVFPFYMWFIYFYIIKWAMSIKRNIKILKWYILFQLLHSYAYIRLLIKFLVFTIICFLFRRFHRASSSCVPQEIHKKKKYYLIALISFYSDISLFLTHTQCLTLFNDNSRARKSTENKS